MAEEQTVELSSLAFPGDPSTYPTIREVPLGAVEFEIKDWSAKKTAPQTNPEQIAKGNKGEKLMLVCQMAVSKPEEFAGFPYTHRFIVGSNEDPMAQKESTWKSTSGATELMRLFKEAGVSVKKDTVPLEALEASKSQHVGGEVKLEKAKPYTDKNTGERKEGFDKHVVKSWFRAGTKLYAQSSNGNGFVAPQPQAVPAGVSSSD